MRRQTTMIFMSLMILSAAMVASPAVLAQEGATAMAEHPLVGAWTIQDPGSSDPFDVLTVGPGGTVIDAGPAGTGYGSWAPTGARSADATFLLGYVDSDAGFLGYSVFRASVEVSEDGQHLSGTYTIEPPVDMAHAFGLPVGQLGPNEVIGDRIAVESMGETVAPIPSQGDVMPAQ